MFTGIVEELGTVRERIGGEFVFEAAAVLDDAAIGDSIAINGCCLTVIEKGDGWFRAQAVDETLTRSNLDTLVVGDRVNLERPMRLGDRLDGHLVQGHVDGMGEIVAPAPNLQVRVIDTDLLRYIVEKGSITVDGCSLTIVKALDDGFTVAIIPHTVEVTTFGSKTVGDLVNLEVDVIAKYVERLLQREA